MAKCIICDKETEKVILCPLINQSICFGCCFAISSGREGIIEELRNEYNLGLDRDKILDKCDRCMSTRPVGGLEIDAVYTDESEQISTPQPEAKVAGEARKPEIKGEDLLKEEKEKEKIPEKSKIEKFQEELTHKEEVKGNILIVGSDQQTGDFFSNILRSERHTVTCVSTGTKAIEQLKKIPFDVIFVESHLPDGKGLETIKKLREINNKAYFIIMTDTPSLEIAIEAVKDYVYEYLAKPVVADHLKKVVEKALERQKETDKKVTVFQEKGKKQVEEDVAKEFWKLSGNRYNIIREIGTGGFASVYKAWAVNLEKFVAVKKIHKSFSQQAKFLDMFRDEAVNSSKLEHENIVRVIDFLKTPDNIYHIIMEYVKGCNLHYLLKRCQEQGEKLSFDLSTHIISEILKSLSYAHSKVDEITGESLGIVHRDVSPGNIMIYFDGRVKITDFGIAKAATRYIDKQKAGVLRGKVAYMSPEQAKGNVEIDHRSDIFSVGIVLYRLLTGQWLFEGNTDYDTWEKVKKGKIDIQPLEKVAIPEELKAIVMKSLEKDLSKRYQSAEEMFIELQKYLHKRKKYAHTLRAELKHFIGKFLKEDIQKEEEDSKKESKFSHKVAIEQEIPLENEVVSVVPPQEPSPIFPLVGEAKEEKQREGIEIKQQEERERTVFDFVLDTANRYKKTFIKLNIGLLIGVIGFIALDTFQHWTSLGPKIYNFFWPPTLSIDTIPSGASVSLQNDKGEEVLKKNALSAVYISKILPGNYNLILKKEGYRSIERRITVFGIERGRQDVRVDGVSTTDKKKKINLITVPFEIDLEINSLPEGAEVYVDGKKLPGRTPLIQTVNVGEHTVKLVLEGLEDLGNIEKSVVRGQCNLDLSKKASEQDGIDHRYWDMTSSIVEEGLMNYTLTGRFWKEISLNSEPQGASIYIDDSKSPWGTTPHKIRIKIGEYKVRLEKAEFEPWVGVIKVDADSRVDIKPALRKWVYFYSYGKQDLKKDIHAHVYVKGTSIKGKRTPFKYPLVIKTYEVTFKKYPQYKNYYLKANLKDRKVIKGILNRRPISFTIVVSNIVTEDPIEKAYILLNKKWVGRTNKKGVWKTSLKAGNYKIKIGKQDEYETIEISKALKWGDSNVKLPVSLSPLYKRIEELSQKGEAYYRAGEWVKAREVLSKLLKIDPNNKKAERYLSRVNREIAEQKAEEIAIKIDKIYDQAKKDFKEKKWLEAYEQFNQIVDLKPDDKSVAKVTNRYIKYIDRLMDSIAQGSKPVDKSKDLFYALGFCYYRDSKYARAITEWERVLSIDPENSEIKKFIKKAKSRQKK